MTGDPRECLERAKNCLRLAERSTTPASKAMLEDFARTWLCLACELLSTAALLEEWRKQGKKKK
jgi:hypothetical protein